jgi:hypothetical protein
VAGEGAPPVPLIALLGHPLVGAIERAGAWLDHVRGWIWRCAGRARMPGWNLCAPSSSGLRQSRAGPPFGMVGRGGGAARPLLSAA